MAQAAQNAAENAPLFTTDIAVLSDGRVVTSNKGDKSVRIYDPANFAVPVKTWTFEQIPTGVTSAVVDGAEKIYVTTFEQRGTLDVIDLGTGRVERSIPVGSGATSPLLSQDGSKVYVLNQFSNTISEVDPQGGVVLRTAAVLREPKGAVISKDGKYLFVTNFLPAQRADVVVVDSAARPLALVECKAPGVRITSDVFEQATRYNAVLGARYVILTNGMRHFCFEHTAEGYVAMSAFPDLSPRTPDPAGL